MAVEPAEPTPKPTPPTLTADAGGTSVEEAAAAASVKEAIAPGAAPTAEAAVATSSDSAIGICDEQPPKQTNTSRCWTCNRKIGLLGFQCKCEYFFCGVHRNSDKHECKFDFKGLGKQQLTRANPTIAASKLQGF